MELDRWEDFLAPPDAVEVVEEVEEEV